MSPSLPWPPRAIASPRAEAGGSVSEAEDADRDLVERLRAREVEALGQLYDRHAKRMRAVAVRIDPESADDIVHEVFLKLWKKVHGFSARASLATWLYRLTVNAALDQLRRRRRAARLGDLLAGGATPPEASASSVHDTRLDLHAALAELPRRFRLPVVLRYYGGLEYAEIARVLRCREGTVASRLSRGLKQLGTLLCAASSHPKEDR